MFLGHSPVYVNFHCRIIFPAYILGNRSVCECNRTPRTCHVGVADAKSHSSTAAAAVKAFLASPEVQAELAHCCSDFLPAALRTNPDALLQRLRDEMKVVELVHNFNAQVLPYHAL